MSEMNQNKNCLILVHFIVVQEVILCKKVKKGGYILLFQEKAVI
jgi:hypothetical protein